MRLTILAARSPPAVPTPIPAIQLSAQSPASRHAVTTNVVGERGINEADPEIPNRPVLSRSEPGPKRAKALPRATTTPPN